MDFSKHKDKFSASVNDVQFGAIIDYSVSFTEKSYTAEELLEKPPRMHYLIKITRRLDASGLWQTVKLYNDGNYKIDITRDGIKTTFSDSELVTLEEFLGADRLIYQTMIFSSFTRIEEE